MNYTKPESVKLNSPLIEICNGEIIKGGLLVMDVVRFLLPPFSHTISAYEADE